MLEFRYRPEGVNSPRPPSLSRGAIYRLRPILPVRVIGPGGVNRFFSKAIADTGSSDVIFPAATATFIGAALLPDAAHQLRWRGTGYPLRFSRVTMELATTVANCRWSAIVGFSSAPLPYPLFGVAGGLEFFDATFRGDDHVIELEPNGSFPGTLRTAP